MTIREFKLWFDGFSSAFLDGAERVHMETIREKLDQVMDFSLPENLAPPPDAVAPNYDPLIPSFEERR